MDKKEYIRRLAITLTTSKKTMTAKDLAQDLNLKGFKTDRGTPFKGGRGTYRLIHAVYDWLVSNSNQKDADIVAHAFTNPDGEYAFD